MKISPISDVYEETVENNRIVSNEKVLSTKTIYDVLTEPDGLYVIGENSQKKYIGDNIYDSYFESFHFNIIEK